MKPAESSTYFALEFDLANNHRSMPKQSAKKTRGSLGAIAQWLLTAALGRHEPEIRSYINGEGNRLWRVYDPISGDRQILESEAAVRTWIEQRYSAS